MNRNFGLDLETQLLQLIVRAPFLIVLVAIATTALWRLTQRPRECWLLLIAAGLGGFQTLGVGKAASALFQSGLVPPTGGAALSWALTAASLVVGLAAWTCIALALFGAFPWSDPPPVAEADADSH